MPINPAIDRLTARLVPEPSPHQLVNALPLQPGQRILEIRPGLGRHARCVVENLDLTSQLDLVDVPEHMLDGVLDLCAADPRVTATVAEARNMPVDDDSIDLAYLVATLPDLPHPAATLRELHRVLRPSGRLLVAEHIGPRWLTADRLTILAADNGFHPNHSHGRRLRYLALFHPVSKGRDDHADTAKP